MRALARSRLWGDGRSSRVCCRVYAVGLCYPCAPARRSWCRRPPGGAAGRSASRSPLANSLSGLEQHSLRV